MSPATRGKWHHFWEPTIVLEYLSLDKSAALLDDIAARLDEPMGDSSILPTFLLCREARRQVTVALGGDGADELFAGYDPFKALYWAELYGRLVPKPIHAAIRMVMARLPTSHRNMSLDFRIKRTLRGLSYPRHFWNAIWIAPLEPTDIAELFGEPVDLEEVYAEAIEYWENCHQDNLTDKTLQFFTKLYLQDDILVKVDRASMMNSLEVRAPFLDIDLVDFVRRIPSDYKCRGGQTKYILKKALEPVLPSNILHRSKKGFGIPIGKWFQEGSLAIDGTDATGLMNRAFTKRLDRRAPEGAPRSSSVSLECLAFVAMEQTGPDSGVSDDTRTASAFASSWNNLPSGSVYTTEQFEDWFLPLQKNDIEGKAVLEFGCGNASLMVHVAGWNPSSLEGVDLGDSVISARRNMGATGFEKWSVVQEDTHKVQRKRFRCGLLHRRPPSP